MEHRDRQSSSHMANIPIFPPVTLPFPILRHQPLARPPADHCKGPALQGEATPEEAPNFGRKSGSSPPEFGDHPFVPGELVADLMEIASFFGHFFPLFRQPAFTIEQLWANLSDFEPKAATFVLGLHVSLAVVFVAEGKGNVSEALNVAELDKAVLWEVVEEVWPRIAWEQLRYREVWRSGGAVNDEEINEEEETKDIEMIEDLEEEQRRGGVEPMGGGGVEPLGGGGAEALGWEAFPMKEGRAKEVVECLKSIDLAHYASLSMRMKLGILLEMIACALDTRQVGEFQASRLAERERLLIERKEVRESIKRRRNQTKLLPSQLEAAKAKLREFQCLQAEGKAVPVLRIRNSMSKIARLEEKGAQTKELQRIDEKRLKEIERRFEFALDGSISLGARGGGVEGLRRPCKVFAEGSFEGEENEGSGVNCDSDSEGGVEALMGAGVEALRGGLRDLRVFSSLEGQIYRFDSGEFTGISNPSALLGSIPSISLKKAFVSLEDSTGLSALLSSIPVGTRSSLSTVIGLIREGEREFSESLAEEARLWGDAATRSKIFENGVVSAKTFPLLARGFSLFEPHLLRKFENCGGRSASSTGQGFGRAALGRQTFFYGREGEAKIRPVFRSLLESPLPYVLFVAAAIFRALAARFALVTREARNKTVGKPRKKCGSCLKNIGTPVCLECVGCLRSFHMECGSVGVGKEFRCQACRDLGERARRTPRDI